MQYKTIVLELIQSREKLHEELRQRRQLLITVQRLAMKLQSVHQDWIRQLQQSRPGSPLQQIQAEALELAIAELDLAAESGESPETDSRPSE